MNTRPLLSLCFLLVLATTALPQGSLTPPPGAPAATMKALDELEPRINVQRPINPLPSDADYHLIISQPGSYYLSANLNVTKTPAGTGSTLADCTARLNTGDGIETANHATLRGCTLSENGGHGINSSSNTTIEGCAARANDGNGIVVVDASLISASVMTLNGKKPGSPVNAASDGVELGARNRVLNCTIFSNGQHGVFSAGANNRNYIDGCLFHSNAGFAISLQSNGNAVVRNQVGGNTTGTINQSGGNIAPIQSASDAVGVMHPLANFQ